MKNETDSRSTEYCYLLKSLWIDRLENEVSASFGYKDEFVVFSEEEAKGLCEKAGVFDRVFWSLNKGDPNMIYKKIMIEQSKPNVVS